MNLKSKKAEISSKVVISLVILLIGFAILFIAFKNIFFGEKDLIDDRVCHESVILRATSSEATGLSGVVPLKCKTEKICLSSKLIGGKCENEFKGAEDINKKQISRVSDAEEILSNELVECWNIMGEGKVSVFSQFFAEKYGIGDIYSSCVVCSRIAFDDEIKLNDGKLEDINVIEYMKNNKVPGKDISYYKYLSGDKKLDIENAIKLPSQEKKENGEIEWIVGDEIIKLEETSNTAENSEKEIYSTNPSQEMAVLFMQISSPGHWNSAKNIFRDAFGTAILGRTLISGKIFNLKNVAKAAASPWFWAGVAILGVYQHANIYKNRGVSATYCGDISGSENQARSGCSVVRLINYDKESISKYCDVIESIS